MTAFAHKTVLLDEAVGLLRPAVGKVIVDGTLGGGGHAERLLEAGAQVIGIDRDPLALAASAERLARFGDAFQVLRGDFGSLRALLGGRRVHGTLVDLGVSSPQLDRPERGFSFQHDGPLDMRMSGEGLSAAELIDTLEEAALADVIYTLGEEPFSRSIARALKSARPTTTRAAVAAIERAVPRKAWPKRIHVATRTFQALRMAVNRELESLDAYLASLPEVLELGGVAAAITFHSLEDRRVKAAFRDLCGRCVCPPGLPICACGAVGTFKSLTSKAITASDIEVENNPRARSAHLRAVEKVQ